MSAAGLDSISRLSRDLAAAAVTLSPDEARFLVDAYYMMQDNRIAAANQVRSLANSGEPHDVIRWLTVQSETLENQVKRALDRWTDEQELGRWSKSIVGIGPIIAAGLLAHIDITKAPTAGHIWRFAGLDPTSKWGKGEKRPWNTSLKTLCWKIGESFVKVSGNPGDVYGKLYLQRKEYEEAANAERKYADQAAHQLQTKKYDKTTEAYKHYREGKLPKGHIHARAKRYAVKLFLSHYHETAYRLHFGVEPPFPYALSILGHAHKIEAPV